MRTSRVRLAALVGAAAVLAGCSSTTDDAAATSAPTQSPTGSVQQSIEIGGTERTFGVYRPEHLPAAAPLVVVLHGALSAGVGAETAYGFDRPADDAGFVVAYPDGLDHVWNAGGCCGSAVTDHVDDVAFITAMIDRIGQQIPLDPARIYVAGFSNGGMMAYTLACHSDRFAAIGAVSATDYPCDTPRPLSVIHVHGTDDPTVPYAGGGGNAHQAPGPGAVAVTERWRTLDQCEPPTTTTDGRVTTSVADCAAGRAVELVTVQGGGHEFPTTDPDTASAIWQFFAAHPK